LKLSCFADVLSIMAICCVFVNKPSKINLKQQLSLYTNMFFEYFDVLNLIGTSILANF
jgi:uncharacterized membrane protein YobD (UPF0266 family)